MPLPSLFISHGAPDLLLHPSPALDFLQQLGSRLGKPEAILAISAHWTAAAPIVSAAPQPETIHDFRGFPAALYELTYGAPGAPARAAQISQRLAEAGIACAVSPDRGLDHGAWTPLMAMYPEADIPVLQLSIQPDLGPAHHRQLGLALSDLRQSGLLILASGALTHNLRRLQGDTYSDDPPDWVRQFDDWVATTIAQADYDRLLHYRQIAPYAVENHPTDEHLLPLFVALGAGGSSPKGERIHSSFTYGVLSMAAYAFT